jgi:hypothetical protein
MPEMFDKKLLVEGNDDQHVIWALCQKYTVKENFDVVNCEGIDKLLEQIPPRLKQSGLQTLGIIIDADTNLAARWRTVRNLLSGLGYSIPNEIPKSGLIHHETGKITIGIWIMPDNVVDGMLEDFIKFLIPEDDELLPVAENTLENIESHGLNKYTLIHRAKALIHSWLAWQEDPGTPMGLAITKRYLTTENEKTNSFVVWMESLFEE